MRKAVRRWLGRRGYKLWKLPRALLRNDHAILAMNLDFAIAHHLMHHGELFFIQVGALDGVRNDPLHKHIRAGRLKGILIEPHPVQYAKLQKNYEGVEGLTLLNIAVSHQRETRTLYAVRQEALRDGPVWLTGLSSFDRETLMRHRHLVPNLANMIEEIPVPCLSLSDVLADRGVDKFDLLQVDTEGFDAQVVRMVDFQRHKPAIIHYEHKHLPEGQQESLVGELIRLGYKIAIDGPDALAYRPPRA